MRRFSDCIFVQEEFNSATYFEFRVLIIIFWGGMVLCDNLLKLFLFWQSWVNMGQFYDQESKISPWSFYNDQIAAKPIETQQRSSEKIKAQLLPQKRLSLIKDQKKQKQFNFKSNEKLSLSKVSNENVSPCEINSYNLDSTNQSLPFKQQQMSNHMKQIQSELQTQIQSSLVVHLILSQLKQQINNQAFLKLQQQRQTKLQQQTIQSASKLKLPKIDKNRNQNDIVSYKFGDQTNTKPIQLTNQLVREVLRPKIKSKISHKIKVMGTNMQIVICPKKQEILVINF